MDRFLSSVPMRRCSLSLLCARRSSYSSLSGHCLLGNESSDLLQGYFKRSLEPSEQNDEIEVVDIRVVREARQVADHSV